MILDDFTHFVKIYFLKTKDETEDCMRSYINQAEAHFNLKVSKLRCDNGGEYRSNDFKAWCKQRGIVIDYTIPHTPELNGKSERIIRTISEAPELYSTTQIYQANCGVKQPTLQHIFSTDLLLQQKM